MDVMLDIETLGFQQNCVVLTLGAVKFDPYSDDEPSQPLYFRINVDEQTEIGRIIDESTMEWWAKQPAEVFEEAMSEEDRISMDEATNQLNKYLVGAGKIWAQGPLFDICIMENFYKMIGKPVPWQYYNIRDSRTLFDLGDDSAKKTNKSAHNALADAFAQAVSVQKIFSDLGVQRKQR